MKHDNLEQNRKVNKEQNGELGHIQYWHQTEMSVTSSVALLEFFTKQNLYHIVAIKN